jgi:hypothetical protein|tara:strand:- start:1171 stop:1296 length:126 start_codon:yes stop_codon:yes gene_type:complete
MIFYMCLKDKTRKRFLPKRAAWFQPAHGYDGGITARALFEQ